MFLASLLTPPRTPRISGLKSQALKPTFFELKVMVKSFFYFEILLAPSELLLPERLNWPGRLAGISK